MLWPFHHKKETDYWLKVFALYALTEACIQLLFFFILNTFGQNRISIIEFHGIMWVFQCLLIWPIWWVAWSVRKQKLLIQALVNIAFYALYTYLWFGPVQDAIGYLYDQLQGMTRAPGNQQQAYLDRGSEYSYLNYQLLKHAFRLSWFYMAAYFYNYRQEEKKRLELAIANRELQLKMLTWHLNPSFYFKTISHLQQLADIRPLNATAPILQLAKVMEYVIYEAKEKLIDVKKEVHFLQNYIDLKNQQPDNRSTLQMTVTGDHDTLKIAPLLLTGFIDKIMEENRGHPGIMHRMQVQFSGQEMRVEVDGLTGPGNYLPLAQGDPLYLRIKEFYPDRFSLDYQKEEGVVALRLKLDSER
ncbi:MAG: histidine kinase [Chitinophagaceae bacterium]|nr:histidine kinase [Chitinophagaceae bacterium]